jgi:hypothetical protein
MFRFAQTMFASISRRSSGSQRYRDPLDSRPLDPVFPMTSARREMNRIRFSFGTIRRVVPVWGRCDAAAIKSAHRPSVNQKIE